MIEEIRTNLHEVKNYLRNIETRFDGSLEDASKYVKRVESEVRNEIDIVGIIINYHYKIVYQYL